MKTLPLDHFRTQFDQLLLSEIRNSTSDKDLVNAVVYTFEAGGKRLRPYLIRCLCDELSLGRNVADSLGKAVEVFHTGSLIHDDLPALDNDDLRRGQPTLHKVFGEEVAILAGDFLLVHPVRILLRSSIDRERLLSVIELWTETSLTVIEGEFLDVTFQDTENEKTLEEVHKKKTGELFGFCFAAPVLCAGEKQTASQMLALGRDFGIVFQIADDIKDMTATRSTLGKTPGKDALLDRPSALNVMDLTQARKVIDKKVRRLLEALPYEGFRDVIEHLCKQIVSK